MKHPPQVGDVIRYAYLWADEAAVGREEARKDRPCAVVLTVVRAAEVDRVVVAPITHVQPVREEDGIEIPAATKSRLGLDDERSWILATEVNVFDWPGPDVRPAGSGAHAASPIYGTLPYRLTERLLDRMRRLLREGRSRAVTRTE